MSKSIYSKMTPHERRKIRVRKRIFGTQERPRLSVFRSAKHIYVQVIDDEKSTTLCSASTVTKGSSVDGKKAAQAKTIGLAIAKACKDQKIEAVVFDRNGFRYHGRVRAVAEAAREGGLKF